MLEELLRALSVATTADEAVCEFWEELLGGALASYLHTSSSSEHSSLTSLACNVLSTMGSPTMAVLKVGEKWLHEHVSTAGLVE